MSRLSNITHLAAVAVIASCASIAAPAQEKFERERGIKSSDAPQAAQGWLRDAFETVRSPKWYQEIYESGISYEAKFKLREQYYSVEFAPDGTVQDVEVEVDFTDLPAQVQQVIQAYMVETYREFRIKRLQIQYSGEPDDLEDFFDHDGDRDHTGLTTRYEIEYTATTSNAPRQYREGLFDDTGQHLQSRGVILPPTVNLIF